MYKRQEKIAFVPNEEIRQELTNAVKSKSWNEMLMFQQAVSYTHLDVYKRQAFIIGRIKSIVPKILCGLFELSIIEQLYTDAVRCRSQLLPGRSFPRKKLKSKGLSLIHI